MKIGVELGATIARVRILTDQPPNIIIKKMQLNKENVKGGHYEGS